MMIIKALCLILLFGPKKPFAVSRLFEVVVSAGGGFVVGLC